MRTDSNPARTGDVIVAIRPLSIGGIIVRPAIESDNRLEQIVLIAPKPKLLATLDLNEFWKLKKGNFFSRISKMAIVVITRTNFTIYRVAIDCSKS
jgi:hypothetical protein